jgi:LmbE family N-acetylglucosaminyl deacetylase
MELRPVVVVAPHPDDESLGCGGTVKHLTLSGVPVDVIYMTSGELGCDMPESATLETKRALAAVRVEEARGACEVLGVRRVVFLGGTDGALERQPDLVKVLRKTLRREPYQRVFCPWPEEAHTDHRATFLWTRDALIEHPTRPDLWLYEVWTPMRANTFVPIDTTVRFKQAAIERHRSQLQVLDYRAAFLGLAAYRALFCAGSRYAEAFLVGAAAISSSRRE